MKGRCFIDLTAAYRSVYTIEGSLVVESHAWYNFRLLVSFDTLYPEFM